MIQLIEEHLEKFFVSLFIMNYYEVQTIQVSHYLIRILSVPIPSVTIPWFFPNHADSSAQRGNPLDSKFTAYTEEEIPNMIDLIFILQEPFSGF